MERKKIWPAPLRGCLLLTCAVLYWYGMWLPYISIHMLKDKQRMPLFPPKEAAYCSMLREQCDRKRSRSEGLEEEKRFHWETTEHPQQRNRTQCQKPALTVARNTEAICCWRSQFCSFKECNIHSQTLESGDGAWESTRLWSPHYELKQWLGTQRPLRKPCFLPKHSPLSWEKIP